MAVLGLDLRARLEKVHIKKKYSDKAGIGFFYNQEIIVNNGNLAVGRDCLVRLHSIQKGFIKRGNFVSLSVPKDFDGFFPHEYVFLGLWKNETGRKYPSLGEIMTRYNPGDIKKVFYIKKDSAFKYGRGFIDEKGFTPRDLTIKNLILESSYCSDFFSRAIIVESEQQLERVAYKVKRRGIYPIVMDNLKTLSEGKIARSYIQYPQS